MLKWSRCLIFIVVVPRVFKAIRRKILNGFKHIVNVRAKKGFEVNDKMNSKIKNITLPSFINLVHDLGS